LNAHKPVGDRFLNLQAQLNGFLDPRHENIKRLGLRVATPQGWHRGDKIAILVLFNHNIKFHFHPFASMLGQVLYHRGEAFSIFQERTN